MIKVPLTLKTPGGGRGVGVVNVLLPLVWAFQKYIFQIEGEAMIFGVF